MSRTTSASEPLWQLAQQTSQPNVAVIDVPIRPREQMAVESEGSGKKSEPKPSPPFLVMALATTIVLTAIVGVLLLSFRASQQRSANAALVQDVLGVVQALAKVSDDSVIDLTIRGPGTIPGLPGRRVSDGTTVFVRRWRDGQTYVRASNDRTARTYRYDGRSFYSSDE